MILEFVCIRWVPKCCWRFAWHGQCGRGQNIVFACKYYASLLHPGVSEPGFQPLIFAYLHFSLIRIVAVKIIAVVRMRVCMCVCDITYTQRERARVTTAAQELAAEYCTCLFTECKNEIQRHAVTRHICGDVCEDENSPTYACLFTHATTSLASLSCLPACSLGEAGLAHELHT